MTNITSGQRTALDDLLVVANTRHGPGAHYHARARGLGPDHDHLADPLEARAYLVDHRVVAPDGPPNARTLVRLATVREAVRALAGDRGPESRPPSPSDRSLEATARDARYRLTARGLEPVATGWAGFVDGLLPALFDLVRESTSLRVCGNPRCRFAFVDHSRNHSRRWCENSVCGNRVRVGRHRLRARARPA